MDKIVSILLLTSLIINFTCRYFSILLISFISIPETFSKYWLFFLDVFVLTLPHLFRKFPLSMPLPLRQKDLSPLKNFTMMGSFPSIQFYPIFRKKKINLSQQKICQQKKLYRWWEYVWMNKMDRWIYATLLKRFNQ